MVAVPKRNYLPREERPQNSFGDAGATLMNLFLLLGGIGFG